MPVTLATSEAKIRRISGQIVQEMLSRKTSHKNRASGVAQGEGPEFKKKKKKLSVEEVETLQNWEDSESCLLRCG
jgi:hypothetical protein